MKRMRNAKGFLDFVGAFAAPEKLEICPALALVDKGWSGGHNEKASLYA
jgi:hypothetical protein